MKRAVGVGVAWAISAGLSCGCTSFPNEAVSGDSGSDAGSDVGTIDGTSPTDGTTEDASADASPDAGDGAPGHDAAADAPVKPPTDASVDAPGDAKSGTGGGDAGDSGPTACPLSPNPTIGVFVAPGGATSSCGSVSAPCGTVTAGLAALAASGSKTLVYVAVSTASPPTPYVEQVTLPAGVTIQGGWVYSGGSSWARPCSPDPTGAVIQAPAGSDRVVIANYTGTSTLDTVTVKNATTATAGQSLYGVFVSGASTNLTLTDVAVSVAAGGAGANGSTGGAGAAAGTAGSCSNGDGAPGSPGAGATSGVYTSTGYVPDQNPATGGGQGHNGAGGTAGGTPGPMVTEGNCEQGTLGCQVPLSPQSGQGTPGLAGCGGGGSFGGTPGKSGGSSVGVFVWDATVTMGGSIAPGPGGTGGSGGTSVSVPGGPGAAGNPFSVVSTCQDNPPPPCNASSHCVCVATGHATSNGGAAGGTGSAGGTGGTGGSGAGGDSFCVVHNSAASVSSSAACTPGSAGVAGTAAGGNPGAAGRSGASYVAP